jgi:hypothetical protein
LLACCFLRTAAGRCLAGSPPLGRCPNPTPSWVPGVVYAFWLLPHPPPTSGLVPARRSRSPGPVRCSGNGNALPKQHTTHAPLAQLLSCPCWRERPLLGREAALLARCSPPTTLRLSLHVVQAITRVALPLCVASCARSILSHLHHKVCSYLDACCSNRSTTGEPPKHAVDTGCQGCWRCLGVGLFFPAAAHSPVLRAGACVSLRVVCFCSVTVQCCI